MTDKLDAETEQIIRKHRVVSGRWARQSAGSGDHDFDIIESEDALRARIRELVKEARTKGEREFAEGLLDDYRDKLEYGRPQARAARLALVAHVRELEEKARKEGASSNSQPEQRYSVAYPRPPVRPIR